MNLLDALKTSFSHRSMSARSLGKKDAMSDAAVASLSMFKVRYFILVFYFEIKNNNVFFIKLGIRENNEYG